MPLHFISHSSTGRHKTLCVSSLSQSRRAFKQVVLTSALNKPRIAFGAMTLLLHACLEGWSVLHKNDLIYAHPLGNKFFFFFLSLVQKKTFLSFCSVCSALRFCRAPLFSEFHCNKNAFHSQFSRSLGFTSSTYFDAEAHIPYSSPRPSLSLVT